MSALAPYGKLIANKLVGLAVPRDVAERMVREQRIAHQWGTKKREVEYLNFRVFLSSSIAPRWGLETAEHIARVYHNWSHCYRVDTTRLAMRAHAEAA